MRRSIARSSLKMCETEYAPDIGRNHWNPRRHADHIIHGRNLPALQRELSAMNACIRLGCCCSFFGPQRSRVRLDRSEPSPLARRRLSLEAAAPRYGHRQL